MFEELNTLELDRADSFDTLQKFMNIFLQYNSNVNLMSRKDSVFLFEKHIFDSLSFNLFYKKYRPGNRIKLLDIGTGGGFPAIPISICYKNIEVSAIDSIQKKIKFLQYAKKELDLKNLNLICARIEEMKVKNKFDICTSRAMAQLRIILEYAIPYIKEGGHFIAYKSLKAEEEIIDSQNALKKLNAKIIDKIEYSLPIQEENKRVLIIVRKEGKTNDIYPRKYANIINNPL